MKRNLDIKNNADEMLFKIFQYLSATGISDVEYKMISAELASTCLVACATFDDNITEEQLKKAKSEILHVNSFIISDIMNNLEKYVSDPSRTITTKGDLRC